MQNMNRPIGPVDRKIDIRLTILGVLAFLLLAGLFFSVGVFYIGPKLRASRADIPPPETTDRYVPPSRSAADEDQPENEGPDIKLEVTEQGVGDASPTDAQVDGNRSQDGADVKTDADGLTITLDGKEKRSADEESAPTAGDKTPATTTPKPKTVTPEKPAAPKPSTAQPKGAETSKSSTRSPLEKPRAATEKRDLVYRVQAGSYADRAHADSLATKLKAEGYRRARVTEAQVNGRTLYRVQVAEYKTSLDAEELTRDLKATGYQPAVMTAEKPK